MNKTAWINYKRKLLSSIFVSKKTDEKTDWAFLTQDKQSEKQNKDDVVLESWKDLLYYSSGNNSNIERHSNSKNSSGYKVEDELGQKILNKAFEMTFQRLSYLSDIDDDNLKSSIRDYIYNRKLHIKGLHAIVKNLKNLQTDDLPDLD
jgi:hypothetical protein